MSLEDPRALRSKARNESEAGCTKCALNAIWRVLRFRSSADCFAGISMREHNCAERIGSSVFSERRQHQTSAGALNRSQLCAVLLNLKLWRLIRLQIAGKTGGRWRLRNLSDTFSGGVRAPPNGQRSNTNDPNLHISILERRWEL